MRNYLTRYKYKWLLDAGYKVHFDVIVVTHFDADHFAGLTSIIEDERFTFNMVYHNGIGRFSKTRSKRPQKYDKHIGQTASYVATDGTEGTCIKSAFSGVADARRLLAEGGLMESFRKFLQAVVKAADAGRLQGMKRFTARESFQGQRA
jgi:hypothetical protein